MPHADIVYQIFPDRFDRPVAPDPGLVTDRRWHGRPVRFTRDVVALTALGSHQHHLLGGTLAGVTRRLDHVADLGADILYLNPIFEARTSHRYDTVDYHRIDPVLGTRADFETLGSALRERDMRLVLDGVFNHTSIDHPWHADPETRPRYYVMRDDGRAAGWLGGHGLPKLDAGRPEVQAALMDILDAWPEVDGWRLDAAHLLPYDLLRRLREHVAPRPLILEDWNPGRHYFDLGLADGLTHFPFREALRTFFVEDASPQTLLARVAAFFTWYPPEALAGCWTYLDNHDLPRFRTEVGPERGRRALVLLLTLPGTPLLFQGIEFGMEGATAEQSRVPIDWDALDHDPAVAREHHHIRTLARLRRSHADCLGSDPRGFAVRFTDHATRSFAFERRSADGAARAVVALHDGWSPATIPAESLDLADPWPMEPGTWRIVVEREGRIVEDLRGGADGLTAG